MTVTQDASAPLVAVVGATGQQGGSVIKALLESDKPYRIRGLTRDTSKLASQNLSKQGVETVAVDVKVGNEKEVHEAFKGATYAFAMTNVDPEFKKEPEVAIGKLLVDAAQAANVKLLVWAGLPSVTKISRGQYTTVSTFDAKAEVTLYAKERSVPIADVIPSGYHSNYLSRLTPQKQNDGTYIITNVQAPGAGQYLIDTAHDYGLFVLKAIESPDSAGSEIHAFTQVLSNAEVVQQLSSGTGKTIKYVQVPKENYMQGVPIPDTFKHGLRDMWSYCEEFGYYGDKTEKPAVEGLARKTRTFSEFVKVTDWSSVLN